MRFTGGPPALGAARHDSISFSTRTVLTVDDVSNFPWILTEESRVALSIAIGSSSCALEQLPTLVRSPPTTISAKATPKSSEMVGVKNVQIVCSFVRDLLH